MTCTSGVEGVKESLCTSEGSRRDVTATWDYGLRAQAPWVSISVMLCSFRSGLLCFCTLAICFDHAVLVAMLWECIDEIVRMSYEDVYFPFKKEVNVVFTWRLSTQEEHSLDSC